VREKEFRGTFCLGASFAAAAPDRDRGSPSRARGVRRARARETWTPDRQWRARAVIARLTRCVVSRSRAIDLKICELRQVVGASSSSSMASVGSAASRRGMRRTRMMTTVIALVCASCASSRGIAAQATWPIVKDLEMNVVDVGARPGSGDTIIHARGGTSVRADAVVFETVAYAEYDASGAGSMADVSARLFDAENRVEALRTALKAAENDAPTLTDGVKTCEDGRAALLGEVEALEAAWNSAGARFTPPTCTGPGARNLIYVYEAALGHNVWSCVCKNDYTGANCDVAPCDTSAFTTLGSCAVANTLAVGASCDLSCAAGSVQDTPLTCTLQGGVGILNTPICTACNSCTNCDGPGKNNYDYTDHTGTNCASIPCDLSDATSAGYTLRVGGTCDLDTNGKIISGATCDIECAANSIQNSQLVCTYDTLTETNSFIYPTCEDCNTAGLIDYTGANCAIAPCNVAAYTTGTCASLSTLPVGGSCDLSCSEVGEVRNAPLRCELQDGVGVLFEPACTACNSCTNCDGPGRTDFDYTDYTGADCSIPPCDLSVAATAGYPVRQGGTCASDANGKIPVGATCDIECAADSVQDSQLTCTWDATLSSFNAPSCVACTGNYTGANCVTAPCVVGSGASDGSCGAALAVGASCAQHCTSGSFIASASTCSASGSTISSPGTCRQMDFTLNGYASSFKLSVDSVHINLFNTAGDYVSGMGSGDNRFYYTAFKLTVDRDAVYHVGHRLGETAYDTSMLIYKDSFDPRDPESNLKYGNDDALDATGSTGSNSAAWFDGVRYNAQPSVFVSLKADTKYVLVMTTYNPNDAIPSTLDLVCGNLDFDGRDSVYKYHDDAELVADTTLTRGACALVAYDPDQDD